MGVQEREYMNPPGPEPKSECIRKIETEQQGVFASSKDEAQKSLRFACPTQASNGKWYMTTIAVTNVPVSELYNALSRCNMAVARLREIAEKCGNEKDELLAICNRLNDLSNVNGGQGYGNHTNHPRKTSSQ